MKTSSRKGAKAQSYQRGCEDYEAGVKVGDNPFDEASDEHFAWLSGWTDCGLDDLNRRASAPLREPSAPARLASYLRPDARKST